jgi:hypothetical protein
MRSVNIIETVYHTVRFYQRVVIVKGMWVMRGYNDVFADLLTTYSLYLQIFITVYFYINFSYLSY